MAITDEIEIRLKRDFGTYPNSVEGRRNGEWVLMDYVDFIVHVFSAEKRAFYGLERLRKSATTISVDDLNAELKASVLKARSKPVRKAVKEPEAEAAPEPVKAAKKVGAKKTAAKKAAARKTTSKAATKKTANRP